MSVLITAGGKTVDTFVDKKSGLFRVKFVPGGELPVELSGLYTSNKTADIAIKNYIERNKPKAKVG